MEPYLKECDVDERSVVIDELENEHLESEGILVLRLSPRNLQAGEPRNQLLVDLEFRSSLDDVEATRLFRGIIKLGILRFIKRPWNYKVI